MLGAPHYTRLAILRSEANVGTLDSRIKEQRAQYIRYIMQKEDTSLIKQALLDSFRVNVSSWVRTSRIWLNEINLDINSLQYISKSQLKKIYKEKDIQQWHNEMQKSIKGSLLYFNLKSDKDRQYKQRDPSLEQIQSTSLKIR